MIDVGLSGVEICMTHVPSYSAHLLGPIPLGESEPIEVRISCITRETKEDAEAVVWEHVLRICKASGYQFDPSEWMIIDLWLVNGN